MEQINNAQNEKVTRGREERLFETQREGLEYISHYFSINGTEQIRACDTDSTGEDIDWKLTSVRDTTAGKILERLEALEAKHLEYVDSHLARLKARLEEGKEEKEEFLQESNQIKSDIYHLAIAQKQANGNGHIN